MDTFVMIFLVAPIIACLWGLLFLVGWIIFMVAKAIWDESKRG